MFPLLRKKNSNLFSQKAEIRNNHFAGETNEQKGKTLDLKPYQKKM